MNNLKPQLTYIFDPICGWCYGSLASVKKISTYPGFELEILPSGLFAGDQAINLTAELSEHILESCQRIQAMTSQVFSTAFKEEILLKSQSLDSYWPTVAMVAAKYLNYPVSQQVALLEILQINLNAKAIDITNKSNLLQLLKLEGFVKVVDVIEQENPALTTYGNTLITETKNLMRQHRISGVPALLHNDEVIDNGVLYLNPKDSVISLKSLID